MASVNRVIIVGNLGRDPELRHTNSGQAVCEMSVATNESWMGKDGNRQERVEWHRVVVWGKTAEACAKHLVKGGQVYVEGKLQTRKFEDKDGRERYITEIVAQDVKFLGGGKGDRGDRHGRDDPGAYREPTPSNGGTYGGPGPDDDLLPFCSVDARGVPFWRGP